MSKIVSIAVAFQMCFILGLQAQNFTSSPYSRFGLGEIISEGSSFNRAMGNAGIALRNNNQINFLNPASYSAFDTLSFLFSGGVTGKYAKVYNESTEDQTRNFNMEYLGIGFPILKGLRLSLGLNPYSRMQYQYHEIVYTNDTINSLLFDYKGDGGLNEFYFGGAYQIKDIVSVGFNATYLFGTLERTNTQSSLYKTEAETQFASKYNVSDFYYRAGVQFFHEFKEKHKITLGFVYDFKKDIKIQASELVQRGFPYIDGAYIDTFRIVNDSAGKINLPAKFGLGLSYIYDDKLLFTADYITQDWTDSKLFSTNMGLTNYSSFRVGLEYTPVPMTKRVRAGYFKRMNYRIGFYSTNTYWKVGDDQIKDSGFSIGLGLPWKNSKKLFTSTTFNLTYQIGWRGTTENNLLKENYHNITFGFSLHDFWFIKPKYD